MSEKHEKRYGSRGWRPSELKVKIGGWFEAQATGWGIAAIPCIILLVLGAGFALQLSG